MKVTKDHVIDALNILKETVLKKEDISAYDLSYLHEKIEQFTKKLSDKAIPEPIGGSYTYTIWSDGACSGNPGPGGWGIIVNQGERFSEYSGFHSNTTNNIMEMTGAIEGLKQTPKGSKVKVVSDSQYVIKGITQWIKGWKAKNWKKADGNSVLNQQYWMELDALNAERQVTWEWVKGHADNPFNERCDELARQAILDNR